MVDCLRHLVVVILLLLFSNVVSGHYNLTVKTLVALKPQPGKSKNISTFAVLQKNKQNNGTLLAALAHGLITVKIEDGSMEPMVGLPDVEDYKEGSGTDARFDYIIGLLQFEDGRLLVSDNNNRCLRMIKGSPLYNTSSYAGMCTVQRKNFKISQHEHSLEDIRFYWPSGLLFLPGTEQKFIVMDGSPASTTPLLVDMSRDTITVFFNSPIPGGWHMVPTGNDVFLLTVTHGLVKYHKGKPLEFLTGSRNIGNMTETSLKNARYNNPIDLLAFGDHNVIMVDRDNSRLSIVDLEYDTVSDVCSGIQGHADGNNHDCQLDYPWCLAFINHTLYIGESGHSGGGIKSIKLPKKFDLNIPIPDHGHHGDTHKNVEEIPILGIVIPVCVVTAFVALICIAVWLAIKKKRKARKPPPQPERSLSMGPLMDQVSDKATAESENSRNERSRFCNWIDQVVTASGRQEFDNLHALSFILIPEKELETRRPIGSGHFGVVSEAFWVTEKGRKRVAIKSAKNLDGKLTDLMVLFLLEANIMQQFDHENILPIFGVCWNPSDGIRMVMPFISNGDLHSLIKGETFGIKSLLRLAEQIASGMAHMSKRRFVHRDLAARNCLVDGNYVVKIADFGLSRDVYDKENYYADLKKKALPWKWMAPECLSEGKFTVQSDVWSFGVLLWELFTQGTTPYPAYNDIHQLEKSLVEGYRLTKPELCPDDVYITMKKTWDAVANNRPSFENLRSSLHWMLRTLPHEQSTHPTEQIEELATAGTSPNIEDGASVPSGIGYDNPLAATEMDDKAAERSDRNCTPAEEQSNYLEPTPYCTMKNLQSDRDSEADSESGPK